MESKAFLFQLYVTEKRTTTEIAKMLGLCQSTISVWLKKYDIPLRQGREAQNPKKFSRELLHELYTVQQKSIETIRKELNTSEQNIAYLLGVHEIPKRSKTAKFGGHNKGVPMSDKQKKLMSEIAKARTKHSRSGVKLSYETRSKIAKSLAGRYAGPESPHYTDGGNFQRYRQWLAAGYEYRQWRRDVFERDGYSCQMCLKKSNGDIQAHHIYTARKHLDKITCVENGITLCEKCHTSIKGKEDEYIEIFIKITHLHTTP